MCKKNFNFVLIIYLASLLASTAFSQNTYNNKFFAVNSKLKDGQNLSRNEVNPKTIYVDSTNTSGIEDGTQANPFSIISEGIDAATEGDTILVAQGTYDENPEINGKTLYLFGGFENGGWTRNFLLYETFIDGGNRNSTLQMYGNHSVIDGFTIVNGQAPDQGGVVFMLEMVIMKFEIANCIIIKGSDSVNGGREA